MSQIGRCCLCDKRVRIPDVDSDAWVRCPHCHEEYQLRKLANDLPPRMQVIGERPVVIDSGTTNAGEASTPSEFPGVAEPFVQGESGSALVPTSFGDEPNSDDSANESSAAPRTKVRSPKTLHANRSKNKGTGFGAVVKVFAGGIAGLLIGQLILWWLPAPYQSDPADLARQVPESLSFLLPPNLQGGAELPTVEKPVPLVTEESDVEQPTTTKQASEPTSERVPATDLKYSLQTAKAETTAFNALSQHSPRHVKTWYGGLKQLAFCVTNIKTIDGVNLQVVDNMTQFLQTVVDDSKLTGLLASEAAAQLQEDPLHDQEGIVVVGLVQSIRPAGELFRSVMQMQTGKTLDVISRSDPRVSNAYQGGDTVLLLGVVRTAPLEMQGYKGANEPIVFGGFPMKLNAANRVKSPAVN